MAMTEDKARVYRKSVAKRLREMQENPYDRAHGTPTGYKYGCRCFHCRLAESERQHANYMKNKSKIRKRVKAYYRAHRAEIGAKKHEQYQALMAAAIKGGYGK